MALLLFCQCIAEQGPLLLVRAWKLLHGIWSGSILYEGWAGDRLPADLYIAVVDVPVSKVAYDGAAHGYHCYISEYATAKSAIGPAPQAVTKSASRNRIRGGLWHI